MSAAHKVEWQIEEIAERFGNGAVYYTDDGADLDKVIDGLIRCRPIELAMYRWNDEYKEGILAYRVEDARGEIIFLVFDSCGNGNNLAGFVRSLATKPDVVFGIGASE